VREGTQYSAQTIAYTKDICNYIYDTYGRFPAHVDTFYTPGMWLQSTSRNGVLRAVFRSQTVPEAGTTQRRVARPMTAGRKPVRNQWDLSCS